MTTAATDSRREFHEKLILSVVDKLVFGLLIVLAGFVLNGVLERRQSSQATKAAIARLRVVRVAHVWNSLDAQQQATDAVGTALKRPMADFNVIGRVLSQLERSDSVREIDAEQTRMTASWKDAKRSLVPLPRLMLRAKRRERATALLLRRNRFWIGERIYPTYLRYAKTQRQLLLTYVDLFADGANLAADQDSKQVDHGRDQRLFNRDESKLQQEKTTLEQARLDVFAVMEKLS